ncbi:MAG: hypothetical protein ACI4SG_01705 [Oligosphaeraceae bacterium]
MKKVERKIKPVYDGNQNSTYNFQGFLRWIVPIGGGKELNWKQFDQEWKDAQRIILEWSIINHTLIIKRMNEYQPGEYKIENLSGLRMPEKQFCQSGNAWISSYQIRIVGIN